MPGFDINGLMSGFAKAADNIAKKTADRSVQFKKYLEKNDLGNKDKYAPLVNVGNQWATQKYEPNMDDVRRSFDAEQEKQEKLEQMPGYDGDKLHQVYNEAKSRLTPEFVDSWEQAHNVDQQKREHRAQLDDWTEKRDARRPEYSKRVLRQVSMGTNPDPDIPDSMLDGWDRGFGDYERRYTDQNGNPRTSPAQMLRLTSQQYTPDVVRNVYDDLFDYEDRRKIRNKDGITSKFTHGTVDKRTIDDGADPSSRQGIYMTGEQYAKYRQAGIPGRDIEDIDPGKIYSKQDESELYGFVPYLVDKDMFDAYNFAAESNFLSNSFNNFANARRIITDYKVTADGNTYSGKALDNGLDKYYNQVNKIDEEDLRNNGLPPMELEDGTVIPGDTMRKIISQMNGEDAGVDIDYGPLGIGNPNPTNPENGFPNGPSGFVPWFVDMALSSAPYFTTPTAIPMAVGNMGTAVQGIKPGANINDGTYRLMSEDPTFDEIATPAMASLLMPLTERIWGPVGSRLIGEKGGGGPISSGAGKVIDRMLGKGPRAELAKTNVPLRFLTGALDEGLEEIPGNIVEELQNSGLANWYMTDNMGENRGDRWGNFWQDAPSSFFGGTVLGGGFGLGRTSEYQGDRAKMLNMLGNRISDLNEHGSSINPGITMDGDILRAIASNLGDYSDEVRSGMEQRISEARPQDLAIARDRFARDYSPGRNAQMRAIVDDAVSGIPGVMRSSVDDVLSGIRQGNYLQELRDFEDDYRANMMRELDEYRYGGTDYGWHRDRVNDWWNPGYGSENYAYSLTPDDVTRRFARGSSQDYLDSLIRQYGEGIFDGNPIGPVLRGVYDTGLAEWDIPNEYPWQRIHRRRIEEQHEKAKEDKRRRERDKFYGPADGLWFDENWLPF